MKKIEANAEFIIATEAEKSDDEPSHLSVEEFEFAKNYLTELKVNWTNWSQTDTITEISAILYWL